MRAVFGRFDSLAYVFAQEWLSLNTIVRVIERRVKVADRPVVRVR